MIQSLNGQAAKLSVIIIEPKIDHNFQKILIHLFGKAKKKYVPYKNDSTDKYEFAPRVRV